MEQKIKTVTTPEQGKELLALGLPESTADLLYEPWPGGQMHLVQKDHECGFGEVPAWTLGALIMVMPKSINPKIAGDEYKFELKKYEHWQENGETTDGYSITYSNYEATLSGDYIGQVCPERKNRNKDLIDCAVELMKDLAKGGYLEERFPSMTPDKNNLMKAVEELFGSTSSDIPLAQKIQEIGTKYRLEHPEEK